MDEFNPYDFYGMGGGSDPFNYYAPSDYSTNFAAPTSSPYGDPMVGGDYQSDEAAQYPRSASSVPGTSGAPARTPSRTPGDVSSGAGTGWAGTPSGSLFGGLPASPATRSQQSGLPKTALTMAQLGMKMLAPPQQTQLSGQNPQVQRAASLWGIDCTTGTQTVADAGRSGAGAADAIRRLPAGRRAGAGGRARPRAVHTKPAGRDRAAVEVKCDETSSPR
jgi:hypothetical protein